MNRRRRGDRVSVVSTLAGLLILAGTFGLRWKLGHDGMSDVLFALGLVIGSGLIAPVFIGEMVAKYLSRGKGGSDAP